MRSKILIADPDTKFLWLAARALAAHLGRQYDIATVSDGDAAHSMIFADRPAVAILASRLAGRGALAIVDTFARSREHHDCRFIAILQPGEDEAAERLIEAGACAALVKPFTAELLASRAAEIGARRTEVRAERVFSVLLAPHDARSALEAEIAGHTLSPVIPAEDVEVVVALSKSPRCRVIFAAEPIVGFTTPALFEYLRSERVRVPLIRIGQGTSRHPAIPSIAPGFSGRELAEALAKVKPVEAGTVAEPPSRRTREKSRYVGF